MLKNKLALLLREAKPQTGRECFKGIHSYYSSWGWLGGPAVNHDGSVHTQAHPDIHLWLGRTVKCDYGDIQ